jgi:asparagine synthase (glutamine-hydrolysing)
VSGIVTLRRQDGAPVERALLERMTAAQRFRGPDGEGIWLDVSVGLGHALHKVTVEGECELQPANLDGRFLITADARIDARDELCARLRQCGIDARTDATDCELILKAYQAWGEDCVDHLLGDFSFALWDASRRKLVCAVDHLGVKPFYYTNRAGLFAGSNSLESVRMHPGVRDQLNDSAVADFLLFGCFQDRGITIYEDIARIPPGHYLVVEQGELSLRRYFTLAQPSELRWSDENECVEAFEELLAKAVRDRLRAPRVAVFMSGGVDSPLLALTAKREIQRSFEAGTVEAFTIVFDQLIPDEERHYAGLAAASLGIPVHFESADRAELYDWAELVSPPQPLDAPVMGPWLTQFSQVSDRFSIALTGYDGDALLDAAVRLHWLERARGGELPALARELAWYVHHARGLPPIGVRTAIARARNRVARRPRPTWLRGEFCARTLIDERWSTFIDRVPPVRSRDAGLRTFNEPVWQRVFDAYDAEASGRALQVRHPFCDLRLVRFALGLPAVPWCVDKNLLRRCLRAMPDEIATRPKTPLQGDPDLTRFRAAGLGRLGRRWRCQALEGYVDADALERGLGRSAAPLDVHGLLRAVGFGVWLQNRRRVGVASTIIECQSRTPSC